MKLEFRKTRALMMGAAVAVAFSIWGCRSDDNKEPMPPPPPPPVTSVWDGTSVEPVGPEGNLYPIASAAQLAWLAGALPAGEVETSGKIFDLRCDIDLDDHAFAPIGGRNAEDKIVAFRGEFRGNDHTISGLKLEDADETGYLGLFSYVAGTVADLHVEGRVVSTHAQLFACGGIAGAVGGGELRNCSFSGEITVSSLFYTGGVAGALMGGALTGCVNRAAVKCLHPSNCVMGGVVGELYGTVGKEALVAGCINYGAVSGPGRVAGIAAEMAGDTPSGDPCGNQTVIACANYGAVTGGSNVGGVVAACVLTTMNLQTVAGCCNAGEVTSTKAGAFWSDGGVVALLESDAVMQGCFWLEPAAAYTSQHLGTVSSDCGAKDEAEFKSSATLGTLNAAVGTWNAANGNACVYRFVTGENGWPVPAAGN